MSEVFTSDWLIIRGLSPSEYGGYPEQLEFVGTETVTITQNIYTTADEKIYTTGNAEILVEFP